MEKITIKIIIGILIDWIKIKVINLGINPRRGGIPPIDIREIKIIHNWNLFKDFFFDSLILKILSFFNENMII